MAKRPALIDPSDTPGMADLLTGFYPLVYRLVVSLSGDAAPADALSREVLQRSLQQLPRWTDLAQAQRWFPHMSVLLTRQHLEAVPFGAGANSRLQAAGPLLLLVSALSSLTPQQREAVLLHHGEGFDLRRVATAMDCSASAAANHLTAAMQRLQSVTGDRLQEFVLALPQLLNTFVPPPEDVRLRVGRTIRRTRWRSRLRRVAGWLLTLAVLAAAAVVAWRGRALLP